MAKKSSFDQLILLPAILHASIQDIFIELTVHFEKDQVSQSGKAAGAISELHWMRAM
jgi:hypothetical protein